MVAAVGGDRVVNVLMAAIRDMDEIASPPDDRGSRCRQALVVMAGDVQGHRPMPGVSSGTAWRRPGGA